MDNSPSKNYTHIGNKSSKELFLALSKLRKDVSLSKVLFRKADPKLLYAPIEVYKLMVRWIELWFKPGNHDGTFRLRKDVPRNRQLIMDENEHLHVLVICAHTKVQHSNQLSISANTNGFIEDIKAQGKSERKLGKGLDEISAFLFGIQGDEKTSHGELNVLEMQTAIRLFMQLETSNSKQFLFDEDPWVVKELDPVRGVFSDYIVEDIRTCLSGTEKESEEVVKYYTVEEAEAPPQAESEPEATEKTEANSQQAAKQTESLHSQSALNKVTYDTQSASPGTPSPQPSNKKMKRRAISKKKRLVTKQIKFTVSHTVSGKISIPLIFAKFNGEEQPPSSKE